MLIDERYVKRSELPAALPDAFIKDSGLYISQDWLRRVYPRLFTALNFNGLIILGEVLSQDWGQDSDIDGYRWIYGSDVGMDRACELLIRNHPEIFTVRSSNCNWIEITVPEFD